MYYRRNADRNIRDLERAYSSGDLAILSALITARLRVGKSILDLEPAENVMPILLDHLVDNLRSIVKNLDIRQLVIFELDMNDTPWGDYAAAHEMQDQLIDVVREIVAYQIRLLFRELPRAEEMRFEAEKIIEEHHPGFMLRSMFDVSTLSMDDIGRKGLIPQFQALQGPDRGYFTRYYLPTLENEQWHEYYLVRMHLSAFDIARALGMKILLMNRHSSLPLDPLNPNVSAEDYNQFAEEALEYNRERGRAPEFLMKQKDTFELARYFALASRRSQRKHHNYGSLPPGRGWGEYTRKLGQRELTVWLSQKELLSDEYTKIAQEDFVEIKAPDTGSIITGEQQFDRDDEWIK